MKTPSPHIERNIHHVAKWMLSVPDRRDPDGTRIDHILWFEDRIDEEITYRVNVSSWLAGVEFAGVPPRYLAEDDDEPGTGLFHLSAPCVLTRWHRKRPRGRVLVLDVIIVARRQDLERARPKRALNQPNAGLMQALGTLVHLPKREQQRLTNPPTNPDPGRSLPEGRDPDGDS